MKRLSFVSPVLSVGCSSPRGQPSPFGEGPNPGTTWLVRETLSCQGTPVRWHRWMGGTRSRGLGCESFSCDHAHGNPHTPEPCRDGVLAWRDPPVLVGLGRGPEPAPCCLLHLPPPALGLHVLGRWHPLPLGTATSQKAAASGGGTFSRWFLLLSAHSVPLPLAGHKGVALPQQFAGWQGFEVTQ